MSVGVLPSMESGPQVKLIFPILTSLTMTPGVLQPEVIWVKPLALHPLYAKPMSVLASRRLCLLCREQHDIRDTTCAGALHENTCVRHERHRRPACPSLLPLIL
jgi:hypothetical protein